MATIDEIFKDAENGTLTLAQFNERASKLSAKFADLSEGKYVSKSKHDDEIANLNKQVDALNETISTRDTDLADIKKKLEEAGTADAEKLNAVTNDLASLKTKYEEETKSYKEQLKSQAYEFAVKEFANGQKFSSNGAKNDFVSKMIQAKLKLDGDSILGANDFLAKYKEADANAFIAEDPKPTPPPVPESGKPHFIGSTPGGEPAPGNGENAFASAFHFAGVRPMPTSK